MAPRGGAAFLEASDLERWTLDELLAEVRQREGAGKRLRGAVKGARSRGRLRARDGLGDVPTPHLVRAIADRQRVIYGVDGRKDLYQVRAGRVRKVADSVAALVLASDLHRRRDGAYELRTTSYRKDYKLCRREPFSTQRLGCFCSGFLVGADVIATAGHCVEGAADLARMRFVFGFAMIDAARARTRFEAGDVYAGTAIIGRKLTQHGPDWALVRLDRPVIGRRALAVRRSGRIGQGQPVFVIGHPNGLPTKFADGASVRDNAHKDFFVANLDTYGGNSGSPVFNARSFQVEGILVRGENDFVRRGGCKVSLVCPDRGCRGEDVTRASVWRGDVPRRPSRRRRR